MAKLYLKKQDFCEYVKFGAISWKYDIFSITAWLKFASKNLLHLCDTYYRDCLPHITFCFYLINL